MPRTPKVFTPEQYLEVRLTCPLDDAGFERPIGYYIFVRRSKHWKALLVRFARDRDAERARKALLRAELYTQARMERAGAARVYQVMMEDLQW